MVPGMASPGSVPGATSGQVVGYSNRASSGIRIDHRAIN
jgi:hypothetical protein